jgi:signal peptidase
LVTIEKKKSFEDQNLVLDKDGSIHSNRNYVSIDITQLLNKEGNTSAETITVDVKNLFDDGMQITNSQSELHENVQTVAIDIKKMLGDVKQVVKNKHVSSSDTTVVESEMVSNHEQQLGTTEAIIEDELKADVETVELVQEPLLTSGKTTSQRPKKKQLQRGSYARLVTIFSDIIFYIIIVLLGLFTLFYIGTNNTLFGYQLYNVIDTSMEPKFQQGSILIVKDVEASSLAIGDAITFYKNKDTIITREIIAINEDKNNTGNYNIQTKEIRGTNDVETALSSNVLGKVMTDIPYLGSVDTFMNSHIEMILIAFTVIIIVTSVLRYFFGVDKKKR